MWFEILPSFMIVFAFMGLPHGVAYWLNQGVVGNFYRRSLSSREEEHHYLRDSRLSGDPYEIVFDIPDAPEPEPVPEPAPETAPEEPAKFIGPENVKLEDRPEVAGAEIKKDDCSCECPET